jgi:hypothetical protein
MDGLEVVVHTPVIPALRKQRQEDGEFKGSVGYILKPYLKKIKIIWALVART